MLINIPRFEELTPEQARLEAGRVLREMAGKINDEMETLRRETDEKIRKIREELKR